MKTAKVATCECCGHPIPKGTPVERHPTVETGGIVILRGHERHWVDLSVIIKETAAEAIADLFGNNGMNFADCIFGTDLPTTCLNFGAFVEHKPDTTETHRYQFDDGSAIVIAGDAWDIEGKELFSFAGNK